MVSEGISHSEAADAVIAACQFATDNAHPLTIVNAQLVNVEDGQATIRVSLCREVNLERGPIHDFLVVMVPVPKS